MILLAKRCRQRIFEHIMQSGAAEKVTLSFESTGGTEIKRQILIRE